MAKRAVATIVVVLAVVMVLVGPTAGMVVGAPLHQTYSFGVPLLVMDVVLQPDGSASISYDITFSNYGSPIDIVDVGTPTGDYNVNAMEASIDGVALGDIRTSEYIDTGVEIHLGSNAIPSDGTGTLHVEFSIPDLSMPTPRTMRMPLSRSRRRGSRRSRGPATSRSALRRCRGSLRMQCSTRTCRSRTRFRMRLGAWSRCGTSTTCR